MFLHKISFLKYCSLLFLFIVLFTDKTFAADSAGSIQIVKPPVEASSSTSLTTPSVTGLGGILADPISPTQLQKLQSLTPSQKEALKNQLGGQSSAPPGDILHSQKDMPENAADINNEDINAGNDNSELGNLIAHSQSSMPKKPTRFGMDYFGPARKRIINLESKLKTGEDMRTGTSNALSRIVGPLDMASSYVNVTIPENYSLKTGDEVIIYYWGDNIEMGSQKLKISDRGEIALPKAGILIVRGMSITQFEKAAKKQFERVYRGKINLIATLDKLKSIQIFVTGHAFRPGSYAVNSVTTLFNALYASGGPNDFGSLRNIKLLRNNKTYEVDFYKYLIEGDSSKDYRLRAGDTIFISKVEREISIKGEVNRPAIYELKANEKLRDLFALAGGTKVTAIKENVEIRSVTPNREKVLKNVDVSGKGPESNPALFDGDLVTVYAVLPDIENIVTLTGAVERPGEYELKKDMRLADLFTDVNRPLGETHLERADIIRRNEDMKTTRLIPVNLGKALKNDPLHNLPLAPMDTIRVYSRWDIKFIPLREVKIEGSVQRPDTYERSDDMRVSDLIVEAGGVLPDTYLERGEILRFDFKTETYELIPLNLNKIIDGDPSADVVLQDRDELRIYSTKEMEFIPDHEITVSGAVQRPGIYKRYEGMKFSDILIASGGLLPGYDNSVEIARARSRGKTEIISLDLKLSKSGDTSQNPLLEDGDMINIRKRSDFYDEPKWVTITGEVYKPGDYPLSGKNDRLSDIIQRAGGTTPNANPKGAIFIRDREYLSTEFQQMDIQQANEIMHLTNTYDYSRQVARNRWLMQKAYNTKELAAMTSSAPPVIAVSGSARSAAAVAMAPGIAKAAGDVTTGAIAAMEQQPGVVTSARKLSETDLALSERIIINLEDAIKSRGGDNDIILKPGDSIHIPERVGTVSVIGAVFRPTTIKLKSGENFGFYIDKAGGYAEDANIDYILISKVDGSILPRERNRNIEAGDIIYVPPRVMSLEIIDKVDKIIDVLKYTLSTVAGVIVFLALI